MELVVDLKNSLPVPVTPYNTYLDYKLCENLVLRYRRFTLKN